VARHRFSTAKFLFQVVIGQSPKPVVAITEICHPPALNAFSEASEARDVLFF
jgi:hypothetical protein